MIPAGMVQPCYMFVNIYMCINQYTSLAKLLQLFFRMMKLWNASQLPHSSSRDHIFPADFDSSSPENNLNLPQWVSSQHLPMNNLHGTMALLQDWNYRICGWGWILHGLVLSGWSWITMFPLKLNFFRRSASTIGTLMVGVVQLLLCEMISSN